MALLQEAPPPPGHQEVSGAPQEARVLLVEDDELFVAVLQRMLRKLRRGRYELEHVGSLGAALERLASGAPDLLVLDLSLPDSSGPETYDRIRELAPDTPIVVFTGDDDYDRALELIHRGAQDYLVKGDLDEQGLGRCLAYAIERMRFQRELERMRREAMAAVRAKSAFLSTMSHEIRTPLTAIFGMVDLLDGTGLEGVQREYVQVLRRCSRALKQLLDDVLDLARLDEGKLRVADDVFELHELAEEAVEIFAHRAHRKRLSISCDLASDVPVRIHGDATRIRQTLLNLIGNAVKFTDRGRVVLSVSRESGAEGEGEQLRFEVSDTGPGIAKERLGAIFERFEQADERVAFDHGGSGLGLALCQRLVELMGGRIEVESEVGRGSVFRFRLPLRICSEEELARPTASLDVAGWLVLVAVDDSVERGVLVRMLRRAGAEVVEAEDAAQARQALSEVRPDRPFDAALLDMRMRGQGGVELLRWLRSHDIPGAPDRIIVLLPMNHRSSDLEACEELEATPIHKPVRPGALARALAGRGLLERTGPEGPPVPDLSGRSLLLAEDSPDSRTVLLAYLRQAGCLVEAVGDGEAVLERWRSGGFDLVLMDVRMPKLDGLEATRRLREEEAERELRRTPVVALSAHALPDEIQDCLRAGCDAHVAKPVDAPLLYKTISRQLGVAPPAFESSADMADLAPGYLERRREEQPELEQALTTGDMERLRTVGHNLKGSAAPYGFPQIGRIGAALESAAKAGDFEAAARAVEELEARVRRAEKALRRAPPS